MRENPVTFLYLCFLPSTGETKWFETVYETCYSVGVPMFLLFCLCLEINHIRRINSGILILLKEFYLCYRVEFLSQMSVNDCNTVWLVLDKQNIPRVPILFIIYLDFFQPIRQLNPVMVHTHTTVISKPRVVCIRQTRKKKWKERS